MVKMTTAERAEALQNTLTTRGWVDVIKPTLQAAIANLVQQWKTGARPEGEANVSDNDLKQRIIALEWVLDWDNKLARIVEQLEQSNWFKAQTEYVEGESAPHN
jgi:hypothetical protein